jgi:hypothetical protein
MRTQWDSNRAPPLFNSQGSRGEAPQKVHVKSSEGSLLIMLSLYQPEAEEVWIDLTEWVEFPHNAVPLSWEEWSAGMPLQAGELDFR